MTKMSLINSNLEEIKNIERIFEELLQFIDNNIDSKILQKANDVTTFLHKSFTDLDIITKNQIAQKSEIYIHPSFKPLTLNVKKAIEIVNKFEMIPPSGGAQSTKDARPAAKGLLGAGGTAAGYNSGNEGGAGIEIDPFTGIPYYDPAKSKSGKSVPGSITKSVGGVIPPNKRLPGGVGGSVTEKEGTGSVAPLFNSIICYGDFEEMLRYNLESLKWEKLKYDSNSSFTGSLRYTAAAAT